MSACPGGEKSGLPPVHTDHPFRSPWDSHPEGEDFRLSLVCCWDAFRRSQLEDADCGSSSEPSPNGISPAGAVAAPNLEEINSQKGMTGMWVPPGVLALNWVTLSLG